MTDKEKLIMLKVRADAMWWAANNMTTDASQLVKAMKDYRQFIINELNKEEPTKPKRRCIYSDGNFTNEELNVLCRDCQEDCIAKNFVRGFTAALALEASEGGMLVDKDGKRFKLNEKGRKKLEAIKNAGNDALFNKEPEKEEHVNEDLKSELDDFMVERQFPINYDENVLEIAKHMMDWQKQRLVKWLATERDYLLELCRSGKGDLAKQYRAELYGEVIAKLKDM